MRKITVLLIPPIVVLIIGMVIIHRTQREPLATGQVGAQHHVTYFLGTGSTGSLTPTAIASYFTLNGDQYTQANSWQEVIDADLVKPLDALILDNGSLALVDQNWVRVRYRKGVVMAGVNILTSELGQLLDETRLNSDLDKVCPSAFNEVYSVASTGAMGTPAAITAVAVDPTSAAEGDLLTVPGSVAWWFYQSCVCTAIDGAGPFFRDIAGQMKTKETIPW